MTHHPTRRRGPFAVLVALGLVLPLGVARGTPGTPPPSDDLFEVGRAVYERGVLPDGTSLRGTQSTGTVLEGPLAACTACHRRSGFGTFEGPVMVPPITGSVLALPGPHHIAPGRTPTGAAATVPWYRALTRPAYDDTSLARALREGLDPDGDPLMPPMPRYDLDGDALAGVLTYLRRLSTAPSPGVAPDALRLATVVTPDAQPGADAAVLGVLRGWARQQPGGLRWKLAEWRLSGPAEGWEAQLNERYREQPVFALLSGVGGAEWLPVHRFCERTEVACVLPSVDVAPERPGDDWSVYFAPGVTLEARVLARHLDTAATRAERRLRQVYGDAVGKRAAAAFAASLGPSVGPVSAHRFRHIAPLAGLADMTDADTLILWLRPAEVAELVARWPQGPTAGQVFLSALLAPSAELSLPPAWKARTGYVSLFDDWSPQGRSARVWLQAWLTRAGLPSDGVLRRQADAYGAAYAFTAALSRLQRLQLRWRGTTVTRAGLLEQLEAVVSKNVGNPVDLTSAVPHYRRLSLAAGQRMAARGGIVLRYAAPDAALLVPIAEDTAP